MDKRSWESKQGEGSFRSKEEILNEGMTGHGSTG